MNLTQATRDPVAKRRAAIYDLYGGAVGRPLSEVPTPALLLDLAAAKRNISRMAGMLRGTHATIRPHIKVHKSVELARMQVDAGAKGLSTATVWEACALAWAGLDDIFVVNTVSHPEKVRVLAELARSRRVLVAVDNAANASQLSEAARAAGSRVGVLIEVDTGMDRAGVDTEEEAIALARHLQSCERLNFEGLTGYEGHCSLEADEQRRAIKQRAAMDTFLRIADRLESTGYPCPIRSAGGTATWNWTAERDGVTEIQAGSYVVMDNFHGRMVPHFEHALTVATTVISRPQGRLIVDAGSKSVDTDGGATLIGTDLEALRFDEEHGVFTGDSELLYPVGAFLRLVPGYAPATVNMHDVYYVTEGDLVIDVWPVFPRGPGHNGLVDVP
ncbi:MAG TPA: alanine racemase [Acidimicrobiales bacterium]|nr:alanine racemase [Acidimicrobiales bacterium]